MFKPVSNKAQFPQMEEEILKFWDDKSIFAKSLDKNRGHQRYVFYDGPPFATGLPHYGHLLAGTIKDIVPRYQTMRGKYVERRFGWDTHGLPIEALAQEKLGVSGVYEIKQLGIDKFNETCRSMVLTYVDEWKKTVRRMGRWVDFEHGYKTMDKDFMESVWWAFGQLWKQGRVYKSHRIMPYSWKLSTPLSNAEASSNYKDVQDPAVTVRAKVLTGADPAWGPTYLLIWTTTPWTLPENLCICAGAKIGYSVVKDKSDGTCYVMADARISSVFKKADSYEVVAKFNGDHLKGWTYSPIFPYYAAHAAEGCFQVLNDDYVTTSDGTGLVHIAPAYGEDDYRVYTAAGLKFFADPLDASCNFMKEIPEYAGRFCKECDKDIIKRMKAEGSLVHQATIVHSYPFCERTDTPLIYRAIDAWYVKVEDLHERFAANNAKVHWTPSYVGDKRFGNWLAEARDWNISRNRYWGSCIPVWVNDDDPKDMICVSSIAELEQLSGQKVTDLHKHFVDKIIIHKDGKTYRRTPEVLDCWFESGSMPYAQQHYPFARKDELDAFFPADFIAEGLDQTRGWFYTLMVLGTLIFNKSPYRNVVVNGLVLAEDGKKMSKHLKNYPDPMTLVNECGADAVRLYMVNSPVVRAENLRFSGAGVKETVRSLLLPWWNAYSFFVTYANADGFNEPEVTLPDSKNPLDRWIVSSLESLVADVTAGMDDYDLQRSVRPFVGFIEDLTNWYIRRSRRRFWKNPDEADKLAAYRTLRYVLVQLSKVAAPFTPFIAEDIYLNLKGASDPESVHLCDFPAARAAARDARLEREMAAVQTVVKLGRQLRTENDLKVRQPLSVLHVVTADAELRAALAEGEDMIRDELNIKKVEFGADETALADLSVKADFRKLGPKFGPKMKEVAKAIAALTPAQAATLVKTGKGTFGGFEITSEEVSVRRAPKAGLIVASEGDFVVGLETKLTPELVAEGLAREFVSHVQTMRKDADFEVAERIRVTVEADPELMAAIEGHRDYVMTELFADDLSFTGVDAPEADLNGHKAKIAVVKM